MAESRRVKVVDGYTALRAAQRAAGHDPPPKDGQKEDAPETKATSGEPRKPGTHIGRTVLPTKHEVTCYECGYTFQQTGRSQNTQCLKCRTMLDFIDYTIDGEWTDSVKTAGKVCITPNGVVVSGQIIGGEITIEGKVEPAASVHANQWMHLGAQAEFKEGSVTWNDLRIEDGASFSFRRKVVCRHIEVAGKLKAKIESSGLVHVHATGFLQGELQGEHLAVDEGGGLKVKAHIDKVEPEEKAEPLKKTA